MITLGFVIGGIAAYAFQILAAADLSDTDYAALNVLWALVFVLSPVSSSRSSRRCPAHWPTAERPVSVAGRWSSGRRCSGWR